MDDAKCSVEGCEKDRRAFRSTCAACYRRLRREAKAASGLLCLKDGCNRPEHARGLCETHYRDARRAIRETAAEPEPEPEPEPKSEPKSERSLCDVGDCGQPTTRDGMCAWHADRYDASQRIDAMM
jgi:hypothetical protein